MRAVNTGGRWLWGVSGVLTAAVLVFPGTKFLVHAADPPGVAFPVHTVIRTTDVSQPVSTVSIDSGGASVRVLAGPAGRVRVTETVWYSGRRDRAPGVPPLVRHGRLTLAGSGCCVASFTLVVPPRVSLTVMTEGGQLQVSGTATTTLDSGGGPVTVSQIHGPLRVYTEGGMLDIHQLTGPLHADSGGGPLTATNVNSPTALAYSEGGYVRMAFVTSPWALVVDTGGGPAMIQVPGGPYAVTTDTGGGPSAVLRIPTNPSATHSLTVDSESGPITISPAGLSR